MTESSIMCPKNPQYQDENTASGSNAPSTPSTLLHQATTNPQSVMTPNNQTPACMFISYFPNNYLF